MLSEACGQLLCNMSCSRVGRNRLSRATVSSRLLEVGEQVVVAMRIPSCSEGLSRHMCSQPSRVFVAQSDCVDSCLTLAVGPAARLHRAGQRRSSSASTSCDYGCMWMCL